MSAYFATVISDPSRVENTTFPLGSDNAGFGGGRENVIVTGVVKSFRDKGGKFYAPPFFLNINEDTF